MLGRLVHKADFERLLAVRSRLRSTHFAVHHVSAGALAGAGGLPEASGGDLSTDPAPTSPQLVDDSRPGLWFGCVVPKRLARRAVTRSLLKRQVRAAMQRHGARLPQGHWLVRLHAAFAPAEFASAASLALAHAARAELDALLGRVAG